MATPYGSDSADPSSLAVSRRMLWVAGITWMLTAIIMGYFRADDGTAWVVGAFTLTLVTALGAYLVAEYIAPRIYPRWVVGIVYGLGIFPIIALLSPYVPDSILPPLNYAVAVWIGLTVIHGTAAGMMAPRSKFDLAWKEDD